MMAIFTSFHIPEKYRHRVLYFGILGAIVLRLLFISIGTVLLSLGEWVLAVFGGIVLITAVKMLVDESKKHRKVNASLIPEEEHDYTKGGVAKFVKKLFPVHNKIEGHDFFVKINGKWFVTALFLALMVIEISDVLFAFDSIPAILSISQDVFIVFSSNIFAILGLRSLYFVLEAMGNKFQYISYAVI
jgi:tellurite resistance protein TerC